LEACTRGAGYPELESETGGGDYPELEGGATRTTCAGYHGWQGLEDWWGWAELGMWMGGAEWCGGVDCRMCERLVGFSRL